MNINQLETPCYIVNQADYEQNLRAFRAAFAQRWGGEVICGYSVKTNNLPHMLRTAMAHGYWAETVSPDEWEFARRCGCPADRIIYNGPQKRQTVLDACRAGAVVNLDNLAEVDAVCAAFGGGSFRPKLGLRVNFDLESACPGETTCVGVPGRFGLSRENGDLAEAARRLKQAGLKLSGLHLHQSSRSRSRKIFETIAETAVAVGRELGLEDLDYIDMGGGFFGGNFFPGKPSIPEYAEVVCDTLRSFYDPKRTALVLEPGAAVLATAMDYLTAVLNIRDVRGQRIVTVDGTLLHINPFMNPHPTPFTMLEPGPETEEAQIIGGSTCMELDRFWPRDMHNEATLNSRFLFHCCGAYMSTHNSSFINAAPNIYVKGPDGDYRLLRRKSLDALFACESEGPGRE